nr:ATP-binding protein [uncultured Rhodopila sp.]
MDVEDHHRDGGPFGDKQPRRFKTILVSWLIAVASLIAAGVLAGHARDFTAVLRQARAGIVGTQTRAADGSQAGGGPLERAGAERTLNILFVMPLDKDARSQTEMEDGLDAVIGFRAGGSTVFFEFLDGARLDAADADVWLRDLVREKYGQTRFDFVVGVSWPGASAIARSREVFPAARRIYADVVPDWVAPLKRLDDGGEFLVSRFDYARSVKEALALTGAGKIYLTGDSGSAFGRLELAAFRSGVATLPGPIAVEDLTAVPFKDVLALAPTLAAGSMIYSLLIFNDGSGGFVRPPAADARLAELASVPVFSQWESHLGSGIVGGYMLSHELVGRSIGALILGHAPPPEGNLRTSYDWRQLERWHLTGASLAADAIIRYRVPSVWVLYRPVILSIAAIIVMLAVMLVLVARLAWQRNAALRNLAAERAALATRVDERTADLTLERQSLAELVRFNETILQSSPVAMGVYLESGQCIVVNKAYTNLVGGSDEVLMSRNFRDIESWRTSGLLERCLHSLATNRRQQAEIHVTSLAGKEVWCDCLILPIRMRGEAHLLIQFFDLTERKETERQVNEARHLAEVANRSKSSFLAMMSHEIRTPITGVIGMADFLSLTALDAVQRSYLDTMQASAKTLLTILNDILDYSKIEADRLTLERVCFDVVAVAAETARLYGPVAQQNGCDLTLDTGGTTRLLVIGDPIRIRQVLGNLVSNAVKFTANGKIAIRLRQEQAADHLRLRFEVEDTGIGLSSGDIGRLFEPFAQADAGTSRKFGGTGLGLAISKRLITMMDGDIGAHGEPGEGALFWFTCVVQPGVEADLLADSLASHVVRPLKVLVAEDNTINGMIVKLGLEHRRHQVTLVRDGRQAVEAASAGGYDIILMDMQMPTMDGVEATRRIRALSPPLCDIPIVALTADAVSEHRAAYMQAGLTDFLTKPIEWNEVDAVLTRDPAQRPCSVPASVAVQALPVINVSRLQETRDMLPPPVFADLLAELANHTHDSLINMRVAFGGSDLAAVKRISHSIKGLCLQFGAERATALAREVEVSETLECAAAKFRALEQALHELTQEIERDWCDPTATSPTAQGEPAAPPEAR